MLGEAASSITTSDDTQAVCTVKGRVFTQRQWYGYLVHKAFHQNYAKIVYQITYPVKECCSNLLIYYDDQVKQLKSSMTCEQRTSVLPPDNNQIIPLRASNDSNGCTFWNETGEAFYVCRGERIFRSSVPRTWFFALSHCNQQGPLNLNYVFNITGYYGECEEDPLAPSSGWNSYVGHLNSNQQSSSNQEVYTYLSISLGIVAGIALILATVFFGLWFLGLRKAAKGKGSSVTSSQATMTQDDIFYVNPSLSDREQADYNQSGSENYYEVIPERRSYESINTGLANGGAHIRQMRSLHGAIGHPLGPPHVHHHPHAHHHAMGHPHHPGHAVHPGHPHLQTKEAGGMRGVTYTFEDYPPPPYQPPKLLGIGKHNTLTHIPGHAHSLSVPGGQRQRPQLVHHAYHSSIVPTSAALGMGNVSSSNVSSSGGGSISPGVGSATTSGQSTSGMNLMNPLSPSSSHMTINPTSSGMQTISQANLTGPSLGTFGVPLSSNSNPGAGAGSINLSGISGHMGHLPASSASSASATPSLAAALSSASSHVPPPAPGQSETSA